MCIPELKMEIEKVEICHETRRLDPAWKSWYCPKCGAGFLYKGRRPQHRKCPGKFEIIHMMSPKEEQELVECIGEEIRKDIATEVEKQKCAKKEKQQE